MKKAYIFPGQGSQFVGMGKDLYESSPLAKSLFDEANHILGFAITDIMFAGDEEALKQTRVTQPAIFLHSVIQRQVLGEAFTPDMVAGHSLGEFSALVASGVLTFEQGLRLVAKRAEAMQKACELERGTMAAILGLEDAVVEQVCKDTEGVVTPANYNCPGQLVISGAYEAVEQACETLKAAGAKRALILPVGGAFHSALMKPAEEELAKAIGEITFQKPLCPIYQNVTTTAMTDPETIKKNLIAQLTAPVKWTQSIQQMIQDGATTFVELAPGKVLQGLVKKINKEVEAISA
ncbi:ACP S-malonyltransferase [Fusobacterium nucleatum]